jgi:uncharacterized cofD-like protein
MSKKKKTSILKNNISRPKRIVCLGGGNAMPKAVLTGLKKYPVKLSAICAMLDSGGSAGRLRKDFNIISPGDIRRALIALANTSPAMENLFNYRFEAGELKGHNFANLFIAALELTTNNYEKTIEEISRFLNIKHEALPVTLDNSELYAVLENGELISGETNIDIPKHDKKLRIKEVFLKPEAKIYSKAAKAIEQADLIVIGPGDLYSSLAQILLTKGMPEAIKKSRAKKIYICNLMTKQGETHGFSVSDFSEEIERFLGQKIDYIVYNNKKPSKEALKKSKKEHPELIEPVSFKEKKYGSAGKFIGADLLPSSGKIVHDPNKLSKIILKLCRQ